MMLDAVDGIELTDECCTSRQNEIQELRRYGAGLACLARQIDKVECEVRATLDPRRVVTYWGGDDPALRSVDMLLVGCIFDWYAVTACNLVRLAGWLAKLSGRLQESPNAYVMRVLPDVSVWRNKVGAHPAIACEDKRDNTAEQMVSAFPQITRVNDRLIASGWRTHVTASGGTSDSSKLGPWCLTDVHAVIETRYPWMVRTARSNQVDETSNAQN